MPDKWAHIRINPQNQKRFNQWRKTNPYASSLCFVANVALAEFFDRSLSTRLDLSLGRQMEKEPK